MCIFSTRRFRIDVLTVVPASDAPLAWSTWEWWGFWESIPLTTKNLSWNENSPKTGWWLQIYLSIFFEDSHFWLFDLYFSGGWFNHQPGILYAFPCLLGTSIPIFRWWKFPWDKSRISVCQLHRGPLNLLIAQICVLLYHAQKRKTQ